MPAPALPPPPCAGHGAAPVTASRGWRAAAAARVAAAAARRPDGSTPGRKFCGSARVWAMRSRSTRRCAIGCNGSDSGSIAVSAAMASMARPIRGSCPASSVTTARPSISSSGRSRRSRRNAARCSSGVPCSASSANATSAPNIWSAASRRIRLWPPRDPATPRARTVSNTTPRAASIASRTARRCSRACTSHCACLIGAHRQHGVQVAGQLGQRPVYLGHRAERRKERMHAPDHQGEQRRPQPAAAETRRERAGARQVRQRAVERQDQHRREQGAKLQGGLAVDA